MENEPDYQIFFFVIFSTIWLGNICYSPVHKHLQSKKVFYTLLILSIVGVIYACFKIEIGWEHKRIMGILSPLYLFFYLLLYKLANAIALKKYKRPIYFSCRVSRFLELKEAEASTGLEFLLQMAILVTSSILWVAIIEYVKSFVVL